MKKDIKEILEHILLHQKNAELVKPLTNEEITQILGEIIVHLKIGRN